MAIGTVKWFNTIKGYGFIAPDGGARDVFFHITSVRRSGLHALAEGRKVAYEIARDENGKDAAVNIELVE